MKQNVRRALAISGIAVVIGTTGVAYNASAKMENKPTRIAQHKELITRKTENRTNRTHRRTIPGVVQSVSDNALEIKTSHKTYVVNISDATRILNLKWNKIPLSDIKTGDKVRVFGTLNVTEGKIAAQTVRDISLGKTKSITK